MKKAFMLPVLVSLLLIASIVMVSAVTTAPTTTIIAGKIYNADFSDVVGGATVEVTCNGHPQTFDGGSLSDGSYFIEYNYNDCNTESLLTVHAFKTNVGDNTITGIIHDFNLGQFDVGLGVVNVNLIPEFGFFVGGLTLLSAVGVFFLVRRK